MHRSENGDEEVFEHKSNFLFVKPDESGWTIAWWESSVAEEGADLYPDPDFDADDDDDDDAWENHVACQSVAALDSTREYLDEDADDEEDSSIFYWVTKEDAEKACAAAMVAVLAYRENPKWAAKALAAGWAPPKS